MSKVPRQPIDKNGIVVRVGSRVRVVCLSGDWFDRLPLEERADVESMVGEIFAVEEIDAYGQPWIRKAWPNEAEGTCRSHSIAPEPREMEYVGEEQAK
ncbi:MAG: hypothetical protein V4858_21075 [Pseudomonadota bacterium]